MRVCYTEVMKTTSILITGAGTGIGKDSAFALARLGYRVLAGTHTTAQNVALKKEADQQGIEMEIFKLDITDVKDVEKAAALKPDILINNAGVGESGPLAEVPFERIENIVNTNVLGTLRLTQECAAHMLRRKAGRIITVTSIAGRVVLPYLGIYHLTKFALEAAFDALRMELAPRGIQVSMVEPGLIYTGFNEEMAATKYRWLKPTSFFKDDLAKMKAHDASITPSSHPTDSVVKAIVHAVCARRPKIRYTVPVRYAILVFLAKFLPDRLKDRVMRKFAGL